MNRFLLVAIGSLFSCLSFAIELKPTYIAAGGNIHGVPAQDGPVYLPPVVDAAAEAWNSLIADPWTLDIHYGWSDSIPGILAQYWGWWLPFGDGRHFMARILFNPNFQWHVGDGPIVGFDLLTVATHEIGHALLGVGPRWTNEIADGDVDVMEPLENAGASILAENNHLLDDSLLMPATLSPGVRKIITGADRDAGMQVSGFREYRPVAEIGGWAVFLAGMLAYAATRRRIAKPLGSMWRRSARYAQRLLA